MPWGWGFAAVGGMAVVILVGFLRIRRGNVPTTPTFIWAGVFVLLLLFMAIMGFLEMCITEFWMYLICIGVMTFGGVLALFREGILKFLINSRRFYRNYGDLHTRRKSISPDVSFIRNPIRIFVFLALASFSAFVALEIADNDKLFVMWPETFWYGYLLCAFVIAGLYFIGQRHGGAPAVGVAIFSLIGIAENFVDRFKEATITPNDLFALGTAMEVGGNYRYELNTSILISISTAALGILFCAFLASTGRRAERPILQVLINIVAGLLAFTGFGLCISVPNHAEVFNVNPFYWDLRYTYRSKGFLLSFATLVQQYEVVPPQGYTPEKAKEYEDEFVAVYDKEIGSSKAISQARAQFDKKKPNIVTVMNESYADLSVLDELHAGYTGPSYTKDNPTDALAKGPLFVSTYGGGTCNSEFEYLTGNTLGYIGGGKYPYVQFDVSKIECLPRTLKAQGYETVAVHPANPNNWNRNLVYANMGFDKFISSENAFKDSPTYHVWGAPTDGATYDEVLRVLKDGKDPQFVMDITLQNHGGYDTGNIPEEDRLDYKPDVLDEEARAWLNEYLACVEASDRDLEKFIDELRTFDEPVVLVFFGDHQPGITQAYNDEIFPNEDELEHYARVNQTVYFIWANYEIDGFKDAALAMAGESGGSLQKDESIEVRSVARGGETLATVTVNRPTSLNYLAAYALQTLGASLTDFQKSELVAMRGMPVISVYGYTDATGKWYAHDDENSPIRELYDQFGMIQYLNFNEKL